MEYRRRRRRPNAGRQRNTLLGAAICILLVSAAVVYLVGISDAGAWLAEHVVAPVFRTLGVGGTAEEGTDAQESAAGQTGARLLELPELRCYALQMGVYASETNAEKQAVELQSVGAGGYILQEEDRYRVLAAAYATEDDLQQVRSQLSDEGLDSAGHVIASLPCRLVVTGTESQVETLSAVLDGLVGLQGQLTELAIEFDREQLAVEAGKSSLAALVRTVEGYLADVAAVSTEQPVLACLSDCCRSILAQFEKADALPEDDRAAFTAYLKYTCIHCAEAYCDFCDTVAALGGTDSA